YYPSAEGRRVTGLRKSFPALRVNDFGRHARENNLVDACTRRLTKCAALLPTRSIFFARHILHVSAATAFVERVHPAWTRPGGVLHRGSLFLGFAVCRDVRGCVVVLEWHGTSWRLARRPARAAQSSAWAIPRLPR